MKSPIRKRQRTNLFRRSLYAKIEIAKKELALDDDAYRDIIAQKFPGKTSRTQLGNRQLGELIDHFKSLGFKPRRTAAKRSGRTHLAQGDTARKMRALWVSLYHLGVLSDPSEKALAAFIKRQVKVDDAAFVSVEQGYRVIEALKGWAKREAGVDWSAYQIVDPVNGNTMIERPRCRVLEAQWRILHGNDLGKFGYLPLYSFLQSKFRIGRSISHSDLTDAQADMAIEALGQRVRAMKGGAR